MEDIPKNPKTIQSVHRALDILEFLIASGDGKPLSAIAEHCALNKTTAFHLIKTLEARGYVEQSPDSLKYKTGGKVFDIAVRAYQDINLTRICEPYLEQLMEQFNETVGLYHYSRSDGRIQAVCTSYQESAQPVRVSASLGRWLPLCSTAVGKMYLSCLKKDTLDETIRMDPDCPHDTEEYMSLKQQLIKIKKQAYCIEREEYEEGIVNISVPIYKYSGRVIASLCVSIPVQRAHERRLKEILDAMIPISEKLSSLPL